MDDFLSAHADNSEAQSSGPLIYGVQQTAIGLTAVMRMQDPWFPNGRSRQCDRPLVSVLSGVYYFKIHRKIPLRRQTCST